MLKKIIFILVPILLIIGGFIGYKVFFAKQSRGIFKPSALQGYSVKPVTDAKEITQEINDDTGGDIALPNDNIAINFPKNSFLVDQNVSVKKITSLGNLKSAWKLVAGVELTPSGTALANLAQLKITLPSNTKPQNLVAFYYGQNGTNFQFAPLQISGNTANC